MTVDLTVENNGHLVIGSVRKFEAHKIGNRLTIDLTSPDSCHSLYFEDQIVRAEIGKIPERFKEQTLVPADSTWTEEKDKLVFLCAEPEWPPFCTVRWIKPGPGFDATPHANPELAAYRAYCGTSGDPLKAEYVCQQHYDMYCKHGVQQLTNWTFEKL